MLLSNFDKILKKRVIMKTSTLKAFNSLSSKQVALKGKITLPQEIVEAISFIETNTEATVSVIIEQALKKYGIVKKAAEVKKEILSQNNEQQTTHLEN